MELSIGDYVFGKNSRRCFHLRRNGINYFVIFPFDTVSVFFNINSSVIASKKDLVNVKEMAEYAIANDKVMVVTGYADSNTGSADYNQKLSEKRAKTVVEQLVKMGVDRNKIEVVAKGGVDTLSPISYNRRVVVTMK